MFGSENQRSATRASRSGVHMLTAPMKTSTAPSRIFAWCARATATGPSVFITSQVAPSRA